MDLQANPRGSICARAVRKTYPGREKPSLAGVDLLVDAGRVCALLGANGAGKTTLVRILTTLTGQDSGTVSVNGWDVVRDPARVRASIGVVGQYAALDEVLTARENLELFARLIGLSRAAARSRAAELLEQSGLGEYAGQRVSGFSGGMRRRLDLVTSMITRPAVLLIDEPTTGLDPVARRTIWAAVRSLADHGSTVLLTTQYLEEADELADDVVILREGTVVATGTPSDLKALVGEPRMELREPTLEDVYLHLHTGSTAA
ncbi:ABC-2 type transport system ATP-binding protein [Murinocardiopsis flavida]|uniref:ABC-2 type transport system ATP-binding protein n=2 Tax=Murinocardiopsis flavida TaxID=645275 RepID=A0A2P8DS98_9ACTN|nr:ABC-2 type transport system ATP-binding protein [Murinocardiopsis flavida]